MKIDIRLIIIMVLLITSTGCKHKKSNTEIFNENFQKNLTECVEAMRQNGADSTYAVQKCACMLHTAFEMDSTIMTMQAKDLYIFLRTTIYDIEAACDSTNNKFYYNAEE